ncbi:MAG: hypothetical protein ABIO35_08370 [Nitrobacter sp.]
MGATAKSRSMADMIIIASGDSRNTLLGYKEADAMYEAVVYHRRWWRRVGSWIARTAARVHP